MNNQFLPAPGASPFSNYAYLQTAPRPKQDDRRDQLTRHIMGQQPTSVAGGVGQMIAGAGMGLRNYMNSQYPAAPGGGSPSFMTGLANLFTGGRNGGLY